MKTAKPTPTPKLCLHKSTGQGYVRLDGRCFYLGRWDAPETLQRYHRMIGEWLANGCQVPVEPEAITIAELVRDYLDFAETYYRKPDGRLTTESGSARKAFEPLVAMYGDTPAASFGPRALKACRENMVSRQWTRASINKQIGRVKRLFRWAVENEKIPGETYHALQAVSGLKRGRCEAKESDPVRPVPEKLVETIKPLLPSPVRAMVDLQLLCAARSGELCILRPCDIDMSGPVWLAKPSDHKNAHHGHERVIYLGPKAQEIIRPFLLRPADAFLFSPREAAREQRQKRTEKRKTPPSCGNRVGTNRVAEPEIEPGERYTPVTYGRCIARACITADVPHFTPHQLRHSAGTRVRREQGLEAAQLILGHARCDVSQVYAEVNNAKALDIAARLG